MSKKSCVHVMDKSSPVALEVPPKSRVILETDDALSGQMTPESVAAAPDWRPEIDRTRTNPATGPIAVRGAVPGQALVVHIRRVDLRGTGFFSAGKGALDGFCKDGLVWFTGVEDGQVTLPGNLRAPASPMIGVIGTAPAGEPVRNQVPGDHGGNMDCNLVAPGATITLPVEVPGGLLALGDVHAVMGDGEVSGQGIEIAAEVEIEVDLLPEHPTGRPFIENDELFATVASGETLDAAAQIAVKDMVRVVRARTGLSPEEAYLAVSACGHVRVCQLVNPLKTVRVEVGKWVVG